MRRSTNIYKRKDGLYEGRYPDGFKKDGTTKYSSVYGSSYQMCKEKLKQAKNGTIIPYDKRKVTVQELFFLYLEHIKKQSTISTYMSLYENHIAPVFGGKRVAIVNHDQVNSHLLELSRGNKMGHVANVKRLLVALLAFAYKEKIIPEKITGIIAVRIPRQEIPIFSEAEQERLVSYCLGNPNKLTFSILLVLFTGIRLGELCALTGRDLDVKSGYLKINKTMIRVRNLEENANTKTKIIIDTPKSQSAIRDIPVPGFLVGLFQEVYKGVNKNAFLLTGSLLTFIEPRSMENKFKAILRKASIEVRNFHVLRHTFATNSITRNYYDYKTLSEILGHSDILITLRKYVHSNKAIKDLQVQNIDRDFNQHNYGRNYGNTIGASL